MTSRFSQQATQRGLGSGPYSRAIGIVLLLAGALRIMAASQLPSHVDESASVLAARMVVEDGIPRFPSGLLYTQGATLSYLLAPIAAVSDHLFLLRLMSVIAGTAAVYFLFRLSLAAFGNQLAALSAALLLACDPTSVRWSGHVRMYALLQLIGILLTWGFVRSWARTANRRFDLGFAALWIVAAFTHLAALLFWPVFVAVAFARYRARLISDQRGLALTLALAPAGPVVLLALNRLVHPPGREAADELGRVSFVGDHLIDLDRFRDPSFRAWNAFFADLPYPSLGPWIMVGVTIALLSLPLLTRRSSADFGGWWNVVTLAGCYWGPILFVAYLFGESHDRYLLHVQAMGLLMVGGAVGWAASSDFEAPRSLKRYIPLGLVRATQPPPEPGGHERRSLR